ncbi:MAG TPA: plastocyanin/azurin family copper-binding protein, partial [Thermoanaerobaculia bacterium]
PFFSDVRAFNTSYTDSLEVTATYRCFITCPAGTPQVTFTLAPRESRAFDDMVASASGFNSPNSAGGVEFSFTGESEQLVVTSRLFSTAPTPTVGMFIPGLHGSDAFPNTVLTSIRNAGSGAGFRTNAGVFNPGDAAVSLTFTIFDGGAQAGTPVSRTVGAHSGLQVNLIFTAAGVPNLSTANAVIVVNATGPLFTYAAVIDNATTDPYLVIGAEDQPATSTPSTHIVHVGQGGLLFVDDQSGNSATTIHVGDTVTWVWEGGTSHGVDAGTCSGGGGPYGEPTCTASGQWESGIHAAPFSWSQTFTQAGVFPYFCDVHQGAMTGRVIVSMPGAARRVSKTARRPAG